MHVCHVSRVLVGAAVLPHWMSPATKLNCSHPRYSLLCPYTCKHLHNSSRSLTSLSCAYPPHLQLGDLKLKEFYFEVNPLIPHIPVPAEQQAEVLPLRVGPSHYSSGYWYDPQCSLQSAGASCTTSGQGDQRRVS